MWHVQQTPARTPVHRRGYLLTDALLNDAAGEAAPGVPCCLGGDGATLPQVVLSLVNLECGSVDSGIMDLMSGDLM